MSTPLYATATGNIGPPDGGVLNSIVITAAGAAASAIFRKGGSGGTIILELQSPVNTSFGANFAELQYQGQLHVTLSGAGASVMVEEL